ncbi:hypothetical protein SEF58_12045, partial [Neomoorella humiferrea]|uniref:hypothetical protein n=1 Tax=Neomoorella humiferrea TaxID=676965 RepID=UPI003D89FEBA
PYRPYVHVGFLAFKFLLGHSPFASSLHGFPLQFPAPRFSRSRAWHSKRYFYIYRSFPACTLYIIAPML